MGVFARSFAATLVAIPVLFLFYFFLFPSDGDDAAGFMLLAIFFLVIPLFIVIFVAIALLSKKSSKQEIDGAVYKIPGRRLRSTIIAAAFGFAIAGVLALLISGIIWEVWLIFAAVGGMLGAIVGVFRRL